MTATRKKPRPLAAPARAEPRINPEPTAPRAQVITCFAFGSNLDEVQMKRRCPSARRVGRAILPGYALTFAGYSHGWGGAVASVVPAPKRQVPGLVYAIDRTDLDRLDRFEGVPFAYERVQRIVVADDGARRRVQLYRQPEAELSLGAPTWAYLRLITTAYVRFGLDRRVLTRALKEALES